SMNRVHESRVEGFERGLVQPVLSRKMPGQIHRSFAFGFTARSLRLRMTSQKKARAARSHPPAPPMSSPHDVILSADSVLPHKTGSSEGSMHSHLDKSEGVVKDEDLLCGA